MDRNSTEVTWARIPYDVLNKLLGYLSRERPWRQVASTLHLVNRHWRDAIRLHFVVLNPRKDRPFNFFRDVNAFSQFPNLHTLVLRNCSFQLAVEWVINQLEKSGREIPSEVNLPVPQKLAQLKKLHRLKIEKPDKLEPFLSVFCDVCPLRCLFLKQACLTSGLIKKMEQMTTLRTLKFRSVDVVPNVSFLDFLKKMDQLEAVDLSFADTLWLGSVTIFTRMQRLNYLRICPNNFDFKHLSALSNIQHLHSLILDGRVDGDRLDLSTLSQVTHLSINCPTMPLWIPSMHGLQSLAIQTSDDFKNDKRRKALTSIAPRLKVIQLIAANTKGAFIRQAISTATDLEILKLTGHTITCDVVHNLQMLKEVIIKAKNGNKSPSMISVLPILGQLPELKSLTVSVDALSSLAFVFLKEPNAMMTNLTKLVADGMSTDAVQLVIHHLDQLRDLRLLNGDYMLNVFESKAPGELPLLKNLCLSSIRPHGNRFDIRILLALPFVIRLDHIGFKGYYLSEFHVVLRSFMMKEPQVLVDGNLEWEPDEFQIPC